MSVTTKPSYNPHEQIEIKGAYLYREGWADELALNIKDMIEEYNIFEDILSPTISAKILVNDVFNLPDSFPIIGGERIRLIFKTPINADFCEQEFVVYKVGERLIDTTSHEKLTGYWLFLCTPDRYRDSFTEISQSYKGLYSEILEKVLTQIKSSKSLEKDDTTGTVSFIAPYWSPLKIGSWITSRAYGSDMENFLFYETLDSYHFKSIKKIYAQEPHAKFFIEPKQAGETIGDDKSFRTVAHWEYPASINRLQQHMSSVFGTTVYEFDATTKNFQKTEFDYSTMFADEKFAKLEKFPIYDDVGKENRQKISFVMSREDGSHIGTQYRKIVKALMASYRLKIIIKGDSSLRVGSIIELDVPSRVAGQPDATEQLTSGKWLIASLKHVIKRQAYTMFVELTKDSVGIDTKPLMDVAMKGIADAGAKQPADK